ncbi:DUF1186 domain-containing protein [Bacteroides sp.]
MPFLIRDEEYDEYEEMGDDEDDMDDGGDEEEFASLLQDPSLLNVFERFQKNIEYSHALPHVEYAYVHPEYPSKLKLNHMELLSLYDIDYYYTLPDEQIEIILALPRTTLLEDLSRIILYELGKTCDSVTDEMFDTYANTLTHVFFLIGELRAEECLSAVLEVFRQNTNCMDYHFGDSQSDVFFITVYNIARNRLNDLLEFMKEPGLGCYPKIYLFESIAAIAVHEPERRSEVIDWFRNYLSFMKEHISDSAIYDAWIMGNLSANLLDIKAWEILPDLKEFYEAGLVDILSCGSYEDVERDMLSDEPPLTDFSLKNIYERYRDYKNKWN